MPFRTLAALAAICALSTASAGASTRPNFPKTISGTISGSSVVTSSTKTVKTTWTIRKLRFKLEHVRSVEGSWTGFYKVTGGEVTYKETETGDCLYEINSTFPLVKNMPRSRTTTPLALTRSLTGRDTYDGDIDPTKKWTIFESCTENDEPVAQEKTVTVDDLFSTGEKSTRIGRAMKGKFTSKEDAPSFDRTDTFNWSLRP